MEQEWDWHNFDYKCTRKQEILLWALVHMLSLSTKVVVEWKNSVPEASPKHSVLRFKWAWTTWGKFHVHLLFCILAAEPLLYQEIIAVCPNNLKYDIPKNFSLWKNTA